MEKNKDIFKEDKYRCEICISKGRNKVLGCDPNSDKIKFLDINNKEDYLNFCPSQVFFDPLVDYIYYLRNRPNLIDINQDRWWVIYILNNIEERLL